jgi:phosphatidylethanolamine/phosphatidyl-N-methylethanolamine N-methyltransferase
VAFLEQRVPGCDVVLGDATRLGEVLQERDVEKVGTVISGLPMVGMPLEFQRAIVHQGLSAIRPGGTVLQYSYSPIPPVPQKKLGVRAEVGAHVLWNLPPATVWRYRWA